MRFDPKNCALEDKCKCGLLMRAAAVDTEVMYWNCANWGRSTLPMPRVGHTDQHYGAPTKEALKRKADELHERQRKQERWIKESSERLASIRHSDPRAHLRKKGIKI